MENILYKIGLSLDSNDSNPVKRGLLNNPIFIFINSVLFLLFSIISLLTNDINVLIVIGDIGHVLHFKVHFAITNIICSSIIIANQIISFIAHRRGERQPFVDLMQALSGSRNPRSIGVHNRSEFNRLKKVSKRFYTFMSYHSTFTSPLSIFIMLIFIFMREVSLEQLIMYCLIHSFQTSLIAMHFVQIIGFQIFIFYCVCEYFKIKLRQVNQELRQSCSAYRNLSLVNRSLETLNVIQREIKHSDTKYWSKFLGVFWMEFGTLTTIGIIIAIEISLTIILLFVILSAASVNKAANSSHKVLSSLYIMFDKYFDKIKAKASIKLTILLKVVKNVLLSDIFHYFFNLINF